MKSVVKRNVSILIAGFCLFGFFPFYALGFIGSDSGPVPAADSATEGITAVPAAAKAVPVAPVVQRDQILVKFSPKDGWGPAKKDEIKLRMIRGQNPTADEREFFLAYSRWLSAFEREKAGK